MAITRAQQARQMLKKGSEPVEQAGVMNYMPSEMVTVPKIAKSSPDTPTAKLAYITPKEQDILIDLNLYGSLNGKPNRGPGGIPSLEGDFGSKTGQGGGKGGTYSGGGGGSRSDNDVSGRRDTGTGDYRDSDRPEDIAARREYEVNRRQREKDSKKIEDEFKKDARATRKEMRKKLLNDKKRRQARVLGILSRAENYVDPITGETVPLNEFGLTDEERAELLSVSNISGIGPKTELQKSLMDNLLEKSDKFSGANVETFKERFDTPDMPGLLGMGLKLFEGPLKKGSRKTKDFFTDDVLGAGKFTYKGQEVTPGLFAALSPAEMQEVYGNYMDRRMGGDIDAYGNPIMRQDDGGPDPILPIIPTTQDPTTPTTPLRNLAGLSPRIGGSIFNFDEFAADGGRIGAAEGGIMDLETGRQMYFLGKLVKKATRAVKKIAKSPIGKAAILGAGLGFAGVGPFKGLASTGFGQGLAGLRGTLFGQAGSRVGEAFVPFKEGLFTKLGLTKGGGSFMPTLKGGITLASILPLLVGKTEEEKKNILDEYYASQQLTPSQSVRGVGSEMDFYNYNLPVTAADGGRIGYQEGSKEPVAKETMPLLDMDGKEMDLREEGGFVPIGRMEKADDVPARLSKNEFVFTADAVRNAGDGNVDKGAEVMYNMMKNLESGGDVSEESQGLSGAREMFQTSKRLEEVL
jgi:hypothetical protein